MIFLGEIIELYLQWSNFLENLMPTLNKETKNKPSMLKIDVSCYFHILLPEAYLQGFQYWGDGGVPPSPPAKNLLIPPTRKNYPLYSLYTKIMLILILIDVQYLQKVVFSFEKGSNDQNHSSSGSHHPIKNPPQQNFKLPSTGKGIYPSPNHSLTLFGKP